MKKVIVLQTLFCLLFLASPALAQSGEVDKIETFIKDIIQVLVTLAGLISAGFFVWGGVGYITSSGNPETLEKSKRTILYSGVGLAIVLGAFVLTNVVSDLAVGAFGAAE
jgi:hypothetical protein